MLARLVGSSGGFYFFRSPIPFQLLVFLSGQRTISLILYDLNHMVKVFFDINLMSFKIQDVFLEKL